MPDETPPDTRVLPSGLFLPSLDAPLPVMSGVRSDDGSLLMFLPGVATGAQVVPGHPMYEMAARAMETGGRFLLVPPDVEAGQEVGGIMVEIVGMQPGPQGGYMIAMQGTQRVTVTVAEGDDGLVGTYRERPDVSSGDLHEVVTQLRQVAGASALPDKMKAQLKMAGDDERFLNAFSMLALQGSTNDVAKSTLIASDNPVERAVVAGEAFTQAMKALEAEHPELVLAEKIKTLPLPPDVRSRVDRELGRLEKLDPRDPQRGQVEQWLKMVSDLPWGQHPSTPKRSLKEIRASLDGTHAGLDDVKDLLVRQIDQVRRYNRAIEALPVDEREKMAAKRYGILLVGPPGTGKTTIADSYAQANEKQLIQVNVGGVYSSGELNGTDRVFQGAHAGQIISQLAALGTQDVVLLLDEADKVTSGGQNGDPFAVLLEVLDPSRNKQFTDRWLDIPFDISEIPVIVTANDLGAFPERVRNVLLDRLQVVELEGYSPKQKIDIAHSHLLPRAYKAAVTTPERVQINDEALAHLVMDHTSAAGMRQLDLKLIDLFNDAETRLSIESEAAGTPTELPVTIDPARVDEVLGDARTKNDMPVEWNEPGFGLWMYVQGAGNGGVGAGNIDELPTKEGKVSLTGSVADGIKESAQAAYGWVAEHREQLGIESEAFEHDLQINYGDIGMPKDGPSAGAMTTLLVASKLMRVPIRSKFTMTGTIEPGGRVGKIGGTVAKIMGAYEAGVDTVLIPKANANDLKKLPEDVAKAMTIIPVGTLQEAIRQAFPHREFDFSKGGTGTPAVQVITGGQRADTPAAASSAELSVA
jgi:ATP-dependent Lon protease